MKIKGIQKLSLIDYNGLLACTIFLFGCNFRCGFCHNPGLVLKDDNEEISKAEILDFLDERKKQLQGVCITGGEPLMTADFDFLNEIKKRGFKLKIDTNGSYPEKLRELIDLNLVDYVSMDIKASPEKYNELCGIKVDMEKIEKSIALISDMDNYEFRTTILEEIHTPEEMLTLAKWLKKISGKKLKRFVLQGFKKEEQLLDDNFKKYKNTGEEYLLILKELLKGYFQEIDVRI